MGRMAGPFEQPRLASPRSMPLLAPDRLVRHEREILGVIPRRRVAARGRITGAGVKVPRVHHVEAETEVADGPLPRGDRARRARK